MSRLGTAIFSNKEMVRVLRVFEDAVYGERFEPREGRAGVDLS